MRLVLLGPPGGGKGTQAKRLAQCRNLIHLATGDLFRAAMAAQTELGRNAGKYISRGNLVPDDIVNGLVREWLGRHKGADFVFDGYPRTEQQAIALESMTQELQMPIDMAVDLKVPDEVIMDRTVGRLICEDCNEVYHLTSKPPKIMGVCDRCRGRLRSRSDDKPSTVRRRLKTYYNTTGAVRQFYRERGLLHQIDGVGTPEEIYDRLQALWDL